MMTETLANGYSSESTQRELFNEYQHDRVLMVFRNFYFLVIWNESSLSIVRVRCLCRRTSPVEQGLLYKAML